MKIIPFPGGSDVGPEENWLSELEAALSGTGDGPRADSWRELRADVRALAPPIAPEFERELGERILERSARQGPGRTRRRRARGRLAWLRRPVPLGAATIVAIGVVVALLVIVAPRRTATGPGATPGPGIAREVSPGVRAGGSASGGSVSSGAAPGGSASHAAASNAPESSGAASSGAPAKGADSIAPAPGVASSTGRVQQLGASIALTVTPGAVQSTADRVAALAVSDGGFVQSSHVNVGQGTGEATLMLSLPSTKLNPALASLGRLAPVRAESQSLQDITGSYDAARGRVADANAERAALLRALSRAGTAGQIDSLHERLSQARDAILQARSALRTISQHASNAEVEVTVVGDAHAGSEGLTLHRGLHDAGRVLVVALVVILVAAAVFVPLALLLTALVTAGVAFRRYRRERVLDMGPGRRG